MSAPTSPGLIEIAAARDEPTSGLSKYEMKVAKLRQMLELAKKKRTYHATIDQKLDIVHFYCANELESLANFQKHKTRKRKAASTVEKASKLLGYSTTTILNSVKQFKTDQEISAGRGCGNRNIKSTSIPRAQFIVTSVRKFVRERRAKLQRTVAKDIRDHLIGLRVLEDEDSKVKQQIRAVQRFLVRSGYRRGRKKGAFTIVEKDGLVLKRNEYLRVFFENRKKPCDSRLREVYLGESYVHHHYKRNDESIYDPNDEQDLVVRELHKGQRYCFACAMQGEDPTIRSGVRRTEEQQAGIVPDSIWIFQGKNVKDYHGTFNNTTFLDWFTNKLLPNLRQPSLIIMDNAAYHKSPPIDAPKVKKMKVAEIKRYLDEHSVAFPANANRPQLEIIMNEAIKSLIRPATVIAAENLGHRVIFTPPYHSDLQPIELLWATLKGEVGRKYTSGITFTQVYDNLVAAFHQIRHKSDMIQRMIEHAVKECEKFLIDNEVNEDEVVENHEEEHQNHSISDSESLSDIEDSSSIDAESDIESFEGDSCEEDEY